MSDMEKQLKDAFEALLDGRKRKIDEDNVDFIKETMKKVELTRPSNFYFLAGQYNRENAVERAVELKAEQEGFSPSGYFVPIYLNYEDIQQYLSSMFKEVLGYTCSTDKAGSVLHAVLMYELKGKGSIRPKGDKKWFSDPFYRRFNDWRELVRTCPLVTTSRPFLHMKAIQNIRDNMEQAKKSKEEFIKAFTEWLLKSPYKDEKCILRANKVFTYEEMFTKDPTNAYEWLKKMSPEVLATFKRSYYDKGKKV